MIPWIQVYSNLPQHPKTSRLADELGLTSAAFNPNTLAVGLLVCLWTWAIQNACDGNLASCSPRAIADACQWKKKPDILVKALIKTGWLDSDMRLHDWEEYASLLMEKEENRKAKTRERVKRCRERKAAANGVTGNTPCNVTETPSNAPTIPNLTIPDHTRPEDYLPAVDNLLPSGGGGDVSARESDVLGEYLRDRAIDPSAYFGVTPEIEKDSDAFAAEIFRTFTNRSPTQSDKANVLLSIVTREHDRESGNWTGRIDKGAQHLLLYAFEAANNAGKPGDWRYILGVLGRLKQRGIESLGQAEDYDYDRKGGL